jgi:two-component system sensor histidine kinase YesM
MEEVQLLSDGIENMVGHLKRQIDKNAEQEKQRRQTELALLQAQINPHFLYNTLDTIIWLMESGEVSESVGMVSSLSNFFRFSLSRGKNVITLAEEEQHIRSYLEIQQMRYRDMIEYEIDIPERLQLFILPKLTLQPLVENALYHGIKNRRRKGFIRVTGRVQNERIVLEVADDGRGMTQERLAEVRGSLADDGVEGFGLRAVHQRIQILFGSEYGLAVESTSDVGTSVIVTIPMQTAEETEG